MKKYLKLNYLVWVIFGVVFFEFLIISRYNHPVLDEYAYANMFKQFGYIDTYINHYFKWGGRYLSNSLVLIQPLSFNNFTLYKVYPILSILSTVVVFYFFMKTIMYTNNRKEILTVVAIVTLLFFSYLPIISDSFYWYTGSLTYQVAINSFILFSTFFLLYQRTKERKYQYLMLFLIFLINGTNEIMVVLFNMTLFIINGVVFYKTKKINRLYLGMFILSCLFGLITILAPGNFARAASIENNHHDLFYSLKSTLIFVVSTLVFWSVKIVPLMVLFYLIVRNIKIDLLKLRKQEIWFVLGLIFIFVFAGVFISFYTQGKRPPDRVLNIVYTFYMFLILLLVYQFKFIKRIRNGSKKIIAGSFLLIMLFLMIGQCIKTPKADNIYLYYFGKVSQNNVYDVFSDEFTGRAKLYDIKMKERYDILKKNKGKDVVIKMIEDHPYTLAHEYIDADPRKDTNENIATFFEVKSTTGKE